MWQVAGKLCHQNPHLDDLLLQPAHYGSVAVSHRPLWERRWLLSYFPKDLGWNLRQYHRSKIFISAILAVVVFTPISGQFSMWYPTLGPYIDTHPRGLEGPWRESRFRELRHFNSLLIKRFKTMMMLNQCRFQQKRFTYVSYSSN